MRAPAAWLFILATVVGCGQTQPLRDGSGPVARGAAPEHAVPTPPPPPRVPAYRGPLRCRLVTPSRARRVISFGFDIENTSDQAFHADIFEPFLDYRITATHAVLHVGDAQIELREPALDVGLHARALDIPPHGTVRLVTPIVLKIDPSTALSHGDPFVWTLVTDATTVRLEATITIASEALAPCAEFVTVSP